MFLVSLMSLAQFLSADDFFMVFTHALKQKMINVHSAVTMYCIVALVSHKTNALMSKRVKFLRSTSRERIYFQI